LTAALLKAKLFDAKADSMPATEVFTVTRVPEFGCDGKRGLGFLVSSSDKLIDAKAAYFALTGKRRDELRSRFDYWLGGGVYDDYFHGWPNEPAYKRCFCFRWKEVKLRYRMYGFLCHPRPKTQPEYEVCILFGHVPKTTWETDPSYKDKANSLRLNTEVIKAVKKAFPEREDKK
jgi:hypothetical protein